MDLYEQYTREIMVSNISMNGGGGGGGSLGIQVWG